MLRLTRHRRPIAAALALLALVVAVAAISASKKTDANALVTSDAPTRTRVSVPAGGKVGTPVGRFTATDVDGRAVRVPVSGKPGAVWFFAGWCGECLPEGQALRDVQQRLKERVNITAISPDPTDSVAAVKRFRSNVGDPPFPFIWNQTASLGSAYRAVALDTTIIYNAAGTIVYRDAAPTTTAALLAAFRAAGIS